MADLDLVRTFLDRRTAVTVVTTADRDGVPEVGILVAPRLTEDGTLAAGEEEHVGGRTFRNLRQNPRATLAVLDPVMDPRARDGVRVQVEFLGAEQDGEELGHLTEWLESFAPGRKIVRRLLFKVLDVSRYRVVPDAPVIQS